MLNGVTHARRLIFERLEPRTLLAADLAITEFMASNQGVLLDADGDSSDWIEIHNRTTDTVDLVGWSLSDDASEPGKWHFPHAYLEPNKYLVLFASGKDRGTAQDELHTNFKLNSGGEYVALYSPDGSVVAEFGVAGSDYPEQFPNISFGATAGGPRYFHPPTPGAANGPGQLGIVAEVHVSVARGFFDAPLEVEMSTAMQGAVIRYTVDASTPTETHGTVYSEPLPISTTTTLRVAAFQDDFVPSDIETHTSFS